MLSRWLKEDTRWAVTSISLCVVVVMLLSCLVYDLFSLKNQKKEGVISFKYYVRKDMRNRLVLFGEDVASVGKPDKDMSQVLQNNLMSYILRISVEGRSKNLPVSKALWDAVQEGDALTLVCSETRLFKDVYIWGVIGHTKKGNICE